MHFLLSGLAVSLKKLFFARIQKQWIFLLMESETYLLRASKSFMKSTSARTPSMGMAL